MTRIQLIAPLLALWRRPSETGQGHRTSNNKTHHCSDDSPRAPFPNTQTNTTRLPRLASGFRAPALLQRFWLLTTSQGFHGLFLPDQADFVLFNSLKVLFLAQLLEMLWLCSEPKCYSLQGNKKSPAKEKLQLP